MRDEQAAQPTMTRPDDCLPHRLRRLANEAVITQDVSHPPVELVNMHSGEGREEVVSVQLAREGASMSFGRWRTLLALTVPLLVPAVALILWFLSGPRAGLRRSLVMSGLREGGPGGRVATYPDEQRQLGDFLCRLVTEGCDRAP
jgi:hypothetical protein